MIASFRYAVTPVVRKEVLKPILALRRLKQFFRLVNNDVISTPNACVDRVEHRTPQQVASINFAGQKVSLYERLADTIAIICWITQAISPQPYLSASLAGRAGRRSGDYHRRTVRRFDCTPQMASNAGTGRRHATSYHLRLSRCLGLMIPPFADRTWLCSARRDGRFSPLPPIVRNTHIRA